MNSIAYFKFSCKPLPWLLLLFLLIIGVMPGLSQEKRVRKEFSKDPNTRNFMGIMTDPNFSATQLVEDVLIGGGCFEVFGIEPIGDDESIGFFESGESSIGISSGIIFSSGEILDAQGPNVSDGTSSIMFQPGDNDIETFTGNNSADAAGIEFSFTPTVDQVEFRFVFASEEYCFYVNDSFNDAFGFFISGPGFNGPFENNAENIALVPGTTIPVSIDNVNYATNSAFYVDNVPANSEFGGGCTDEEISQDGVALNDIEYDGFTTVLTASASVIPCETYRIKMVVSDVGDGLLDSAVFLEANSFNAGSTVSVNAVVPHAGGTSTTEGCSDAFFEFVRNANSDISDPLTINYVILPTGTATNGVDYETIPTSVTIPAGQTSVVLPIIAFEDGIAEGPETILLELDQSCTCSSTSVEMVIMDAVPIELDLPVDESVCIGDTAFLQPSLLNGGVPAYNFAWSDGQNTEVATVSNNPGTYFLTVTDACNNEAVDSVEVVFFENPVLNSDATPPVCDGIENGSITLNPTSGTAPYNFDWNTGDNTPDLTDLGEGFYAVTVSDANGCVDSFSVNLANQFQLSPNVIPTDISCFNANDGTLDIEIQGGTPDYQVSLNNQPPVSDLFIESLEEGVYIIQITDANGCTVTDVQEITNPPLLIVNLDTLPPLCPGQNSGAIVAMPNGGTPGLYLLLEYRG